MLRDEIHTGPCVQKHYVSTCPQPTLKRKAWRGGPQIGSQLEKIQKTKLGRAASGTLRTVSRNFRKFNSWTYITPTTTNTDVYTYIQHTRMHIYHMHNSTHTTQQTLYKHIGTIHNCQQACSHVYNTCHTPYTCTHPHTIHQIYYTYSIHATHIHAHTHTQMHMYTSYPMLHALILTAHIHTQATHHTQMHPPPHPPKNSLPGQVLWGELSAGLSGTLAPAAHPAFFFLLLWMVGDLESLFQRRKWKIHFSCCCSTTWKRFLKRCQANQEQLCLPQGSHSVN